MKDGSVRKKMSDEQELTLRLNTVLTELSDVMKQRKERIEEIRTQVSILENENDDMHKRVSELIMDAFQMIIILIFTLSYALPIWMLMNWNNEDDTTFHGKTDKQMDV